MGITSKTITIKSVYGTKKSGTAYASLKYLMYGQINLFIETPLPQTTFDSVQDSVQRPIGFKEVKPALFWKAKSAVPARAGQWQL